jgi:NitT/TauT family transport system ATP-binding protein
LAGLIVPTTGEILYQGQKLQGLLPDMCMVFQNFALYPWLTVKQNISIVLKAAHVPTEEIEKRTQDAIALVGLAGFEDSFPKELSGGMKQRVGIARALVLNPKMLFMDEPFSEVDAFTAEVLRAEVIKIWARKDLALSSILLVSHDIHEVVFMADTIIVLGINPSCIRAVIKNPLPRPRDYLSAEFLKLVEEVHDSYGRIEMPTIHPKPKKEKVGPLLDVTVDEILGLIEYLRRHGGSEDVFRIGAESRQHFDKVARVLHMAELLGFIDTVHRTAKLNEKGHAFLEAAPEQRHGLWKEELLTIPLFIKICDLLKKAPNQCVQREELIAFLKKELPHQNIQTHLAVVLHWGHFGHLFTYHKRGQFLKALDGGSHGLNQGSDSFSRKSGNGK